MINDYGRLGLYYVDNLPFVNKFDAFEFASKHKKQVKWNFNDEIYSSIDWSIPIEKTLTELYRERAQQLRDKYDYVSLFFSGGVDSVNVLHSFLDNDIFLDEIIIMRPFSQINEANTIDKSVGNIWSEIEFTAIPHLKKYLKNSKTLVRIIDMEEVTKTFLDDNRLSSQFNRLNHISANSLSKMSLCATDKIWNNLYRSEKTIGHIQGIDKPIIKYQSGEYSFHFNDGATSGFHFEPLSKTLEESEMIKKYQYHEFFYWTPDLPQLLIKQCQVVKNLCQNNVAFKLLFMYKTQPMQDRFIGILKHIYPEHVNSVRDLFITTKASIDPTQSHQKWIEKYTSYDINGKFSEMINNCMYSVDDRFFYAKTNWLIDSTAELSNAKVDKKRAFKSFISKKHIL